MSRISTIIISRRFLQTSDLDAFNGIPRNPLSPLAAGNNTVAARRPPAEPTPAFDSSMALTILVLLTALFFLGFFSVYIRRFAAAAPPPPPAASRKGGGGLDSSAVDSLPLVAYGGAAKHRMIDECPICLSEFSERETVKLIPYCGHVFHPSCIDTWLASHVTCPLCRSAELFQICLDVAPDINDSRAPERSTLAGVRRASSSSNLPAIMHFYTEAQVFDLILLVFVSFLCVEKADLLFFHIFLHKKFYSIY
ncbi:RING-H2 finger protein ATL57 [Salvia miltiorrhiza]|uniref:RING-H2 finger protein ATL57 n=1 Tax=Salvia miltiorrhiza TaxID=226208 RepID=UPI0025AC658A|nr:RING-H2 finger protein ATL57 [Salvia miltiorrhiza]